MNVAQMLDIYMEEENMLEIAVYGKQIHIIISQLMYH